MAKLLLDSPEHPAVLSSVMLGDEGGLDNFEMRHYAKEVFGADGQEDPERAINQLDGFMIYGTDVLSASQAYQDVKDFLAMIPALKLRALHGTGNPVEVLNGVLAGVDIFESEYPLQQA